MIGDGKAFTKGRDASASLGLYLKNLIAKDLGLKIIADKNTRGYDVIRRYHILKEKPTKTMGKTQ